MEAQWITEPAGLCNWLDAHPDEPLALDTEFERVSTFYPIPGLVQLGFGEEFRLVDPSVAAGSARFRAIMADPGRRKLLYAMSEDLELFRHWLALEPAGVIDLQIGAAMAGAGFSMGYAKLVEKLFGATLDKSATRSDWLARPLSAAQEKYATDDIRFLKPIYEWVWSELGDRQLVDALIEESARFAQDLAGQDDPANHYLKLRGGWTLSRQQQGVLKALVCWREIESRERDRPRGRVVADALLIAIAEKLPDSVRALADVQGLPAVVVRRYGERIVELVRVAASADNSAIATIPAPLSREDQALYKRLRQLMVEAADARDIPVELLAPRKRLEAVVQTRDLGAGLFSDGWRRQVIAPVYGKLQEIVTS